jgi:hypothetical protein
MELQDKDYFSYLLRLYQSGGKAGWRASLENPHNGQKMFFLHLEQLFSYLEDQCAPQDSSCSPNDREDNSAQEPLLGKKQLVEKENESWKVSEKESGP